MNSLSICAFTTSPHLNFQAMLIFLQSLNLALRFIPSQRL